MSNINKLLEVMKRLRDPESGCPWDLEQDFRSIYPYTIEEAYEVADAIDREDWDELRAELGDLLLQVVFHSQMAKEKGLFEFSDVVQSICDKMVRRHPHVFGDEQIGDARSQTIAWEAHKKAEREAGGGVSTSALEGIALALPALLQAQKIGKRASAVGFDWPDVGGVHDKIHEELAELNEAVENVDKKAVDEEFGDLLFAVVNLARHLNVNAEDALRSANAKFSRRFQALEKTVSQSGKRVENLNIDELEAHWSTVKLIES